MRGLGSIEEQLSTLKEEKYLLFPVLETLLMQKCINSIKEASSHNPRVLAIGLNALFSNALQENNKMSQSLKHSYMSSEIRWSLTP